MIIINLAQVTVFFLIVARLSGLFLFAPVFSDKRFFALGKITLILWLAGLLIFVVPFPTALPGTGLTMGIALLMEILIGALMGFTTDILIAGIEFCGTLMDTQAGLSVASLLDPSQGRQVTLFSYLLKWTSLMIFFILDGHHMVLSALVQSFKILPPGVPLTALQISKGCWYVVSLGSYIFYLGVQLASPVLLIVFLVDFGFGMLNKVAEQVNVFQLGFQIKPTVTLIIFLAMLPSLTSSIYGIMERITEDLLKLFYALQS